MSLQLLSALHHEAEHGQRGAPHLHLLGLLGSHSRLGRSSGRCRGHRRIVLVIRVVIVVIRVVIVQGHAAECVCLDLHILFSTATVSDIKALERWSPLHEPSSNIVVIAPPC